MLEPMRSVTVSAARLARRTELEWRRRKARRLLRQSPPALRLPGERGYSPVDVSRLEHFDAILDLAHACRREREAHPPADGGSKKDYLVPLLTPEHYRRHPEIFEFALDRTLLGPVTDYLGSLPVLTIAQLLWTPRQESSFKGSQLYHVDNDGTGRQAKLLANLVEVKPENGPFTLLPADVSERVMRVEKPDPKRFTDEQIRRHASPDDEVAMTGPPGTGVLVDTNRCLHFGGRSEGNERLIVLLQWMTVDQPYVPPRDYGELAGVAPAHLGDEFADAALRRRLRRKR